MIIIDTEEQKKKNKVIITVEESDKKKFNKITGWIQLHGCKRSKENNEEFSIDEKYLVNFLWKLHNNKEFSKEISLSKNCREYLLTEYNHACYIHKEVEKDLLHSQKQYNYSLFPHQITNVKKLSLLSSGI